MKGRSPGSLASVLLGLFVLCAAWSSTSAASTSAANSIEDRDADIRQLMKTLLFYLRDRIQSSKAGMPFRLHVPGPKLGPQSGLIARPQHVHAVVGNPGPAEDLPSPDFEDPDRMDFHDSDKRQFDDYGHMRFGKRAQHFDDYGHMRFGRSLNSMTKSQPASSTSGNQDFQQGNQHAVNSFKSE